MRAMAEFVKTTLIGGLLIVLPIYLTVLLLLKSVAGLIAMLSPVTDQLPAGVEHRQVVGIAVVLLLCFVAGILVRTRPGALARRVLEERLLMRIPGYDLLRNLTRRLAGSDTDEATFTPALVEVEEALAPAFIIEELPDGRYTVIGALGAHACCGRLVRARPRARAPHRRSPPCCASSPASARGPASWWSRWSGGEKARESGRGGSRAGPAAAGARLRRAQATQSPASGG